MHVDGDRPHLSRKDLKVMPLGGPIEFISRQRIFLFRMQKRKELPAKSAQKNKVLASPKRERDWKQNAVLCQRRTLYSRAQMRRGLECEEDKPVTGEALAKGCGPPEGIEKISHHHEI